MAKTEKADKAMLDKCRIITPVFRASYPHVFKAAQVNGKGEPKYSITMLFKKSQDISAIRKAIKYAKIAKFGPDESDWPEELDNPIKDGDGKKFRDKEGYKGHWVIKAISNEASKPGVVDVDPEVPLTSASDFYPGVFARAQVFARCWEFSGKEGIHFILDHVQKVRDGKNLSGKKAASEVFTPITADEDEDDTGSGEDDDDIDNGEDAENYDFT